TPRQTSKEIRDMAERTVAALWSWRADAERGDSSSEAATEEPVPTPTSAPEEQRQRRFDALVRRVQGCQRCPPMEGRSPVLGTRNGSLTSRVLLVAEAPGRLGADRSQIPLSGDQTGRNFEILLGAAGLDRAHLFITNAVLCNPRDSRGR